MNNINHYGWNDYFHSLNDKSYNSCEVARVISIKGARFILITENGETESELTGKQLYGLPKENQPKVGDWVTYIDYGTQAFILEVLPRINTLFRQIPGSKTGRQVMVSNITKAVIIQGLDHDFNLMRLERYIVQILACNINPVVILNKADLISDRDDYENRIRKLQRNIPVYFCSTYNNDGIQLLKNEVFKSGFTYVFIGSSGVGKSSLINALSGTELKDTDEISSTTGKGKHTTTTRDLFKMPNGSLVIDTPGMREFGIGFSEEYNAEDTFPIIHEFAERCRYANCKHLNEKGCAVIDAVANNTLDVTVYDSYLKLMKEQDHFEKSIAEKNREGKRFGKMVREAHNYRKKYKY